MSLSLGVIETYGLIAAIQAADAACKSASVEIVGYKKIGSGLVSVCFEGEISAVKTAITNGVAVVKQSEFVKGQLVIARPEQRVVVQLSSLKGRTIKPTEPEKKPLQPAPIVNDSKPTAPQETIQPTTEVNASHELKKHELKNEGLKKNKNK